MKRDLETIEKEVNNAFNRLLKQSTVVFDWKKTNEKEYLDAVRETIMNCFLFQNSKDYDPLSEAVYVLHFYGCVLSDDIVVDDESEVV